MKYNWNMEEIKRDKILYEYIKNLSEEEKEESKKTTESISSQLLREFYMLDQYPFMKKVADDISRDIVNGLLKLQFRNNKYTPISIDDSLALTHDFYIDILKDNTELLNIFMKEFNNRFNQIRIEKYTDQIDNGFALYSKKLHKSFLQINTYDELEDLFTIIHEYGHVLSASLVNRSMPYNPFIEFESTFMELIAIDYFKKYNEFKKDCSSYKEDTINEYIFGMNALHNRFAFYEALKYYQYYEQTYDFNKKDLPSIIKKNTGCTKEELKAQLSYDIDFNMPYLCAEAYAFDFVSLYRNDPEKAINIYYNMIKFTGNYSESPTYMNKKIKKLGLNSSYSYKRF